MSRASILLVHPDEDAAGGVAERLRAEGFEVVHVLDGERAIDQFIQQPVDVLVAELVLPGRDGATTAESIRWAPGGQSVVVVVLSTLGSGRSAVEDAQKRTHATSVYEGPMDPERVVQAIVEGIHSGQDTARIRDVAATDDDSRDTENEPVNGAVIEPVPDHDTRDAGPSLDTGEDVTRRSRDLAAEADEELSRGWSQGVDARAELEARRVSDYATVLTSADTPLTGSLKRTPFPEVLARIYAVCADGVLVLENIDDPRTTITGAAVTKAVHFEQGLPVSIQSNLVHECLGPFLSRAGRISAEVFESSLERMRDGDNSHASVLVSMDALSQRELEAGLEDQLHIKLFDLFAWMDGSFRFGPGIPAPESAAALKLSLTELIYRGVVHRMPAGRVRKALEPHMDAFLIPQIDRCREVLELQLTEDVRSALLSLDGETRLREVLMAFDDRAGPISQVLYTLMCLQGVELNEQPKRVNDLMDLSDAPDETSDQRTILSELQLLANTLQRHDFEAALGVKRNDPQAASIAASTLRKRFRAIGERTSSPQIRRLAREVAVGLSHAEKALTAPARRREDEEPTAVGKHLPADNPNGPAPGSDAGVIPEDAGDLESTLAEGLSDETSDERPHASSSDSGAPTASADTSDQDGTSAAPEADEPDRRQLDERVHKLYQAERHFRRGRRLLDRGRYSDALAPLLDAVQLCPEAGEFRAYAAYAKYLSSEDDRETVFQELATIRELAAEVPRVHLLFARVAGLHGDFEQARDAFQAVLALDPECQEAQNALAAGGPQATDQVTLLDEQTADELDEPEPADADSSKLRETSEGDL